MDYTLTYGATTQTFEEWGLTGLILELKSFDVGTAAFVHTGASYDGTALFAHGQTGVIKLGEDIIFRGTFASPKRSGHGNAEMIQYVLRDAWHDLTRTPYPPDSVTGISKLFTAGANIGTMYFNVIEIAAAAGVAIQFGSADDLVVIPLEMETRDVYCGGVLAALRKYCPDVQHWIDYSATPYPAIHFVRRGSAAVLNMPLQGSADDIDIDSMEDLQPSRWVIRYVRTNAGEEWPETEVLVDAYPSEAYDLGAVVLTMDLRGRTIETQSFETANISPSARSWWSPNYHWLQPSNADLVEGEDFGFFETERLMLDVDGNWVADSSGSVFEVKSGAEPQWLNGTGRQVLVRAKVRDFTLNGSYVAEEILEVTVNASAVAGGTYTRVTFAGETPPSGLAQMLYAATSVLHYQGQYVWESAELSLPLPHCGCVLNLTGGEAAARGWTAMNAVIHTVRIDVPNAKVTIDFGPPKNLEFQDLFGLSQVTRNQLPAQAYTTASGGGIRRAAGTNTLPPKPAATGHPFFIKPSGEIMVGTVNGGIPTLSSSPIGVGGPALTLSGSGYVYIEIEYTPTWSFGYLASVAVVSIKIVGSSTPKVDGLESGVGKAYQLIAQVVSGGIVHPQPITANLTWSMCPGAVGAATAVWHSV